MATTLIAPSPAARKLFGMMVARADDDLHLTLAQSIHLSVNLCDPARTTWQAMQSRACKLSVDRSSARTEGAAALA
jgi:hypothetical protein